MATFTLVAVGLAIEMPSFFASTFKDGADIAIIAAECSSLNRNCGVADAVEVCAVCCAAGAVAFADCFAD